MKKTKLTPKAISRVIHGKPRNARERKMREEYEAHIKKWDALLADERKAIADSQRITAADLAIVINAK